MDVARDDDGRGWIKGARLFLSHQHLVWKWRQNTMGEKYSRVHELL
jgi:hypothetical protein